MLSLVAAADFLPLLCCEFPGVGGGCVGGPQVTVTGPSAGPGTAPVELQTNLREVTSFTITEKEPPYYGLLGCYCLHTFTSIITGSKAQ